LLVLAGLHENRADPVWVFPSAAKRGQPVADISHVWNRVRHAAGLGNVRMHDLRHSFASNIVNAGGSLPMIGKLLGHRNVSTTARYAHLSDDPVRALADRAAGDIAAALAGKPAADVVLLGQPDRRQKG
jgi:site-specific recombinase XerD